MPRITRKNKHYAKVSVFMILTLIWVCGQALSAETTRSDQLLLSNSAFIYTPAEMLTFNIESYLGTNAPALVNFSEIISHWSGYSSISPKIIIALIEYQTGLVSAENTNAVELYAPLGNLSEKTGFSEQVRDVAVRLADQFYQNGNNSQLALQQIMMQNDGVQRSKPASFVDIFYQLFPLEEEKQHEERSSNVGFPSGALPPDTLLQLPYPVGESWRFGGSHTSSGSGSYPQSSLDFFAASGGGWGTDTSGYWVSASTGGTAVRHSSCSVEVISPGGEWSTSYYHLDNVQITTNQGVSRNTPLANYADNEPQALCNGGSSTGPHVHFSLKQNGLYSDLNGVKLSGYSVHTGQTSYDTDCNYFWIEENGVKHCAWSSLYNPGIIITVPAVPGSVSASDGTYNDKVAVNWSSVAGATSYRLFRCTSTLTASCTEIYSGSVPNHSDYTGTSEITYYYRVQACSNGCSGYSHYDTGYRTQNVQYQFPWATFLPAILRSGKP